MATPSRVGIIARGTMYKRLATGWTALLAVAMSVLSLRPFFESDVFWHLGLGREVLRAHARTVAEPWALPGVYAPRCVVPEWLWDVATWLLYRAVGFGALHALVALCAGASAVAIVRLARRRGDDAASLAALAPVSALATLLAFTRVRERPESAVMVLLPLFVAACLRFEPRATHALPPRRIARALAPLALATLLWAQLHPTAVLAAPVFALCAAPRARRHRDARPERRPRVARDAAGRPAARLSGATARAPMTTRGRGPTLLRSRSR